MSYQNLYDAQIQLCRFLLPAFLHSANSARLLQNPTASDITIRCKGHIWKCQSAILSQRCEFFKAACEGEFKESQTRVIELDDEDPEYVDVMLKHIYTLENPEKCYSLGMSVQTIMLADKYNLPLLRESAKKRLLEWFLFFNEFETIDSNMRAMVLSAVEDVWNFHLEDRKEIIDGLLSGLVDAHDVMTGDLGFQNLLISNPELMTAYMVTISERLKEKTSSERRHHNQSPTQRAASKRKRLS